MSENLLQVLQKGLGKLKDFDNAGNLVDEELNGGDDVDEDTVKMKPTCNLRHKEALMAAFTVQKYVADINKPFARRLETILASFKVRMPDTNGGGPHDGDNIYY